MISYTILDISITQCVNDSIAGKDIVPIQSNFQGLPVRQGDYFRVKRFILQREGAVAPAGPGPKARERQQIPRETEDGFRIDEAELKLRGAGNLFGSKQGGLPDFKLADPVLPGDFLAVAADDARMVMERPGAEGPAG